jgi:hypothetical protein
MENQGSLLVAEVGSEASWRKSAGMSEAGPYAWRSSDHGLLSRLNMQRSSFWAVFFGNHRRRVAEYIHVIEHSEVHGLRSHNAQVTATESICGWQAFACRVRMG